MGYLSCVFGIVILTGGIFLAKSVSDEIKQAQTAGRLPPTDLERQGGSDEWTIPSDLALTETANHAAVLPKPIPYHPLAERKTRSGDETSVSNAEQDGNRLRIRSTKFDFLDGTGNLKTNFTAANRNKNGRRKNTASHSG